MTTTQEPAAEMLEISGPSLIDMAEMLAQIADKLLSVALVMAAVSEKEVPRGSLIERLLKASQATPWPVPQVTQALTGSTTTTNTITTNTTAPTAASLPDLAWLSYKLPAFGKAVADFASHAAASAEGLIYRNSNSNGSYTR